DIQRLTHNAKTRPENESTDAERQRRIDPVLASHQNYPATDDNRCSRERISNFVQKGAADIDVPAGAVQQKRNHTIHHYPGSGDADHQASTYVLGVLNPAEGFVKDDE